MRMVPMGTHEWNQYMNPEEVDRILEQVNVRTISKAGAMISNPFTFEMAEFPNWLRGNYMMMAKRLV